MRRLIRQLTAKLPRLFPPHEGERARNAFFAPLIDCEDERRVSFLLPSDLSALLRAVIHAGIWLSLIVFVFTFASVADPGAAASIIAGFVILAIIIVWIVVSIESRYFKADQLVLGSSGWEARKKGKIVDSGNWDEFLGFRLKNNTRTTWVEFVDVSGKDIARITLGTSLIHFQQFEAFRKEMLDRVPRFGIKEIFTPVLADSNRDQFIGGTTVIASVLVSVCAWLLLWDQDLLAAFVFSAVIFAIGILISLTFRLQGRLAERQIALVDRLGPTEFTTHAARPAGQFLGNFFGLIFIGLFAVVLLGLTSNGLGMGNVFWVVPAVILTQLRGNYVLGTRHLFIQHDRWTVSDGKQTVEFNPIKAVISERRRFGFLIGGFAQIEEEGRMAVVWNDVIIDTTVYQELQRSQKRARIDSPTAAPTYSSASASPLVPEGP